jgi:serine/threonine protein phosphatase PrpC
MTLRSGHRRGPHISALLSVVACAALLLALAPSALAAPSQTASVPNGASRPPESVAYARVAVVRVLTYYNGSVNSDPAPIPVPGPCASDGVLVGTTGNNLNSFDYVLTPTSAVNPLTPCQGVQAAFQQLYGNASGWSIGHIDVLLNAAYTGTDDKQLGSIKYSIDPSQIGTNGGAGAPKLLALALATPAGAPAHDLPVLSVPGPSDPPADAQATVIDLSNYVGQPLGRDSETANEVSTTVYPITVPSDTFGQAPTPTAAATGTLSSGTPTHSSTAPATSNAPSALSGLVSVGAPEVDSNGRLIGIVAKDSKGSHVLLPLDAVNKAIGPVSGKSGPLMTQWRQGLDAYYASPAQYSQAATAFGTLAGAYPDFGGVAPFRTAAQQQTDTIPSLTKDVQVTAPGTQPQPSGGLSKTLLLAIVGAGLVVIVLLFVVLLLVLRGRRQRAALLRASAIPPEEAMLNLLPRDMPLEALPLEEPTLPQPIVVRPAGGRPSGGIEQQATMKMPVPQPPLSRPRQSASLMPHPAGLTDPGVKRAAEPNQDNILALQGIRLAGGRVQPFGLFIVADGMGGHLNGQEASRLAIEIVTTVVLQTLNTGQPLDDASLTSLLRGSVQQAGADLRRRNLTDRVDMGTTITAALVVDDKAYIVNVGDSRTYVMSPESGLRQVTTDHSVVASLVAAGVIRPDDIYTHPRRNQIYRSLGGEQDDVEVDSFEVGLQAGDKLLLCSDGLWEMVRDPQIEHILRATADPRQAAELLVREANANGGEDNISAVVVRLLEDVPQQAQPGIRVVASPPSAQIPLGR